ncbi:MAG TPA: hypothetical protein VMZ03_14570 [Chitinophagaceae bacterium]|nr:hypothetical protein [Chitinophagaceae bacterium]
MSSPQEPLRARQLLNRCIILGFMVLIGFAIAKAIYHKSFMGVTLAIVSFVAAIYFLYILAKAKEEMSAGLGHAGGEKAQEGA